MTPPASALPLNRAGLTRRVPARLGAIGIAVAIVLVLLAPAGRSTLWDRDEPRFARATLEMLGAHRLLYPTFNGEVRAQKPILVYWLMALSVTALGPTETAFRLWSPVGIAIAALCTFAIGRRFLSGPGALAAMGVMAFSPLAIVEGSLATTDAVLLGATTAAITAFVGLAHQPTWRMTVALAGSLSVALLTKGPVGLVVPLAVMGACIGLGWPANRRAVLRRVAIGSAVSIIAYAAWLVPATVATSGAFLSVGIWRDNVGRALAPMEGHGGSVLSYLPYYPLVMLLAFLPWSLALPVALRRVGRGMHGPELRALVFAWIFAPLVLFTLVATKLPHYILPVWPALGLAVGATLDCRPHGGSFRPRPPLARGGRRRVRRRRLDALRRVARGCRGRATRGPPGATRRDRHRDFGGGRSLGAGDSSATCSARRRVAAGRRAERSSADRRMGAARSGGGQACTAPGADHSGARATRRPGVGVRGRRAIAGFLRRSADDSPTDQ